MDGVAWIMVLVALLRYPVDWPLALRRLGHIVNAAGDNFSRKVAEIRSQPSLDPNENQFSNILSSSYIAA